jgi:hypothetical protein
VVVEQENYWKNWVVREAALKAITLVLRQRMREEFTERGVDVMPPKGKTFRVILRPGYPPDFDEERPSGEPSESGEYPVYARLSVPMFSDNPTANRLRHQFVAEILHAAEQAGLRIDECRPRGKEFLIRSPKHDIGAIVGVFNSFLAPSRKIDIATLLGPQTARTPG